MLKKYFKIILIFSLLLIIITLGVVYFLRNNKQETVNQLIEDSQKTAVIQTQANSVTIPTEVKKEQDDEISVSLIVGGQTIVLNTKEGKSFYDALVEAKEEKLIDFAGQNYPALGFFLTDIGDLHSGNDKDLMYYINGKEAYLGVSSYKLKDGDILKWQLE